MVDVARLVLQRLAIDVIALIKGKDVGIAPGESLGTFFLRNPGANILNDPSTLLNVLGCEESLSSNPRRTNTYLNLHRSTFWFLASSVFSLRGRPLSPQGGIIGYPVYPSSPQRTWAAPPFGSTTSIWMGTRNASPSICDASKMKSRPVASLSSYRPH